MMSGGSPHVQVRLADGRVVKLSPPCVIGRMSTAELSLADPRISEAHALLSLRGAELHLLALRGRLSLDGQEVDDVTLEVGQRVGLADGVDVLVEHVELPRWAIAAKLGSRAPVVLSAAVYSVAVDEGDAVLRPGFVREGLACLWRDEDRVLVQVGGGQPVDVEAPTTIMVGSQALHLVLVPMLGVAETAAGRGRDRRERSPLRLTLRYDTAHFDVEGKAMVSIGGIPARILGEIHRMGGGPVHWRVVAGQIWPREDDLLLLTDKWQKALQRLRSRLIGGGVREDLFYRDRSGTVEIVLRPGDEVVDAIDEP